LGIDENYPVTRLEAEAEVEVEVEVEGDDDAKED